ncbi:MAG TPA: hypothetical protein VJV05_14255 [Pyrinomonadaceae bacterium]|nr:hypothetical protein [Pyrinomonadaceae bacterium]
MRNTLITIAITVPLVLGCGIMDRAQKAVSEGNANTAVIPSSSSSNTSSNKTITDHAVDTAVGEKKIGIAECDEAMDLLEGQANNPDDNFVTKAVKKTALNTFREQLKKNLEENKADKKEVAKFCTEFKDNMADSLKEGNSNVSH